MDAVAAFAMLPPASVSARRGRQSVDAAVIRERRCSLLDEDVGSVIDD